MKNIIILLLFLFLSFAHQSTAQQNGNITGVWQDLNAVGSGWSDTYMFYSNGEFKFFSSQMDCSKREISHHGTYIIADNRLKLKITGRTVIEGGHMELSTGSCGSDSTLTGGIIKKIILSTPVTYEYSVSEVTAETENDAERYVLFINGVKHWRFAAEPAELINQFEFE